MKEVKIPKFVLFLFGFLLITASVLIGMLLLNEEDCAIENSETETAETVEISDINDKCKDVDLYGESGALRNLENIEKIENETSYGIVITVREMDENGIETGDCKLYITDYIEEGLGVSNSDLGALSKIVYLGEGSVAYNYGNAIYTQKIEQGAKVVLLANQSLASETSLGEKGEILLFEGPFLVDNGEKTGISETGQFVFLVNFTFGCEPDTPPEYCTGMSSLYNELEEKGVTGWWMYKGAPDKEVVHFLEE